MNRTAAVLLAGLLLAALPAHAEEPIRVTVGGAFEGYLAGSDQMDGPGQPGFGRRGYAIYRRARIDFGGDTALDDGVKVGFRIILRGNDHRRDQIDQSWVYLENPFGRVEMGRVRSAAYQMHYAMPGIQTASDPWLINRPAGDFTGFVIPTATLARRSSSFVDSPKSARVVYYTPRIAGVQVGLSYAPDGCLPPPNDYDSPTQNGPTVSQNCPGTIATAFQGSNDLGQQGDRISAGINYLTKIGTVELALSAGYLAARVENSGAGRFRNQQAWNVGGQLRYAGFILGGAFKTDNHGTVRAATTPVPGRETDWNIGLVRTDGRWRYGVGYAALRVEALDSTGSGAGHDRYDAVEIGGSYELGPGISLTAGTEYERWKSRNGNPLGTNRGWAWQAGVITRF